MLTCCGLFIQQLKKVESVDVDDEKRQTPLHVAAALGKCDVIKVEMEKNAFELVQENLLNGNPSTVLVEEGCAGQQT